MAQIESAQQTGRRHLGFFGKLFGSTAAEERSSQKKRVNLEKRFSLHNRLGQGSMSKVWRATDNESGRQVCLKILDRDKLVALKKRFVGLKRPDEGEVAVMLHHPNIVKTYEWGLTTKKEEYLVMELIEGVGLNFLIDTKSRQLQGHELDLLIQVGEALGYFHERGFIHRDICPRNVMVTAEGVVKLIDFGLAVPNTPQFRRPGNRTGTANYMAPELIRRAPTDQRIDLFSLGVTVYEALTGGLPWESAGAASYQAMLQHINVPGRDPRELRPELDDETVKVIKKGIERDPALRFQTANAFIAALRRLKGEPVDEA